MSEPVNLCDNCKVNPAVIFFKTFNGKEIGEESLCPKCAIERFTQNKSIENYDILGSINEMQETLAHIAGQIANIKPMNSNSDPQKSCRFCNSTESDITSYNQVGCTHCYDEFKDIIKTILFEHSQGTRYKGYIDHRFRAIFFKSLELEKLKLKLQTLLREEAYEEAAKINQRITKLEETSIKSWKK